MSIRVVIYEDNPSLQTGLFHLINGSEGFVCAGAFGDCLNIMNDLEATTPDVILMDIQLPGMSGIEAVRKLKARYPDIKVLMQTIFEDEDRIFQSICAGASGYILKNTSPARLLDLIRETYHGGAPMSPSVAAKVLKMVATEKPVKNEDFNLSDREKEVLACLVKGMSYKMIAQTCFISVDTVRSHIRNIYDKLHVHSKGEAVAAAIRKRVV